jgi:hypothetical protein
MIHDLHAALLPKMRERKSQAILAPVRKAKRFSVDTRARKFLICYLVGKNTKASLFLSQHVSKVQATSRHVRLAMAHGSDRL